MLRSPLLLAIPLALLALPVAAQSRAEADSAAKAAAKANTLPLIMTRTLTFTTDEGTWISLDVSPDGHAIVFDLLGDLYTLPIGGGKATRITSGPAFDAQPRWSPDGKRIVFTSDRSGSDNLWIVDADGSRPHALTKGEKEFYLSPTWMPDGNYVVAAKGGDLWLYHADGGSGIKLTGSGTPSGPAPASPPGGGPRARYLGPAFAASDARYIWVNVAVASQGRGGYQGERADAFAPSADGEPVSPTSNPRFVGAYQIGQYDRETGKTFLRSEEITGALRPIPSPDGHWLVYTTRYDARPALKLRDLTTGDERWLAMDVQPDDQESRSSRDVYPGSAFTPDSKALITSYGGKIWRVEIPSGRATPIPFSADVEQQLGPLAKFDYPVNDSVLTVAQIRGARPSPDGRKLVFTALDRLWIADLPAGRGGPPGRERTMTLRAPPRRLTTMAIGEHSPVWSPNGEYVAYVTWSDSSGGNVYRVRANGTGRPERLTRVAAFYDRLSYSPDGTKIVGTRGSRVQRVNLLEDFGQIGQGAELELVWLPASGGDTHRVTLLTTGKTMQGRGVPHFGPDTSRIYIYDETDGLVSMRFDGTDRRPILKVTGTQTNPNPDGPPGAGAPQADEIVLSPDGRRALALVQHNVYLVTVAPIGGLAPTVSVAGPTSVVPEKRLTRVGGDFVGWQNDGTRVYYSIGHSFFRVDLALADSLARDSVARAEATSRASGGSAARPDTTKGDSARSRGAASTPAYEPQRVDVVITVPKDKPRGTVVLRGARIITMRGNEVIENGDLVVRDNRIAALGASGTVTIPPGARVVDVSGKTMLPGYVDIHSHLWVPFGVHRTQVSQYLAQLAYGITTLRDPQTLTEDVLSYGDLVETGELLGPRIYSTGPGIFSSDPIKSLDDARDVLRRYSEFYDTKTIKQYLAGDRKVRQWVITAARELRLTTTTEGGADFRMNLTLMQDGYAGLEHSLPIHPLFTDVVKLLAFSGITYTPTLIVSYGGPQGKYYWLTHYDVDRDARLRHFTPHDELDSWRRTYFHRDDQYVFAALARELTKVVAAGGRVGLGGHGELQGLGTHWELWMLGSGGMANHDVLRIGTQYSADAIGLGKDIGSLEVGKLADLQVLDANPLVDLKNTNTIRYVMKNGRLYEAATLNEIWPTARALPAQWWWRLEPGGGGRGEEGGDRR